MVTAERTSLLEAARALQPLIEQYRDQGEADRTMPAPLVDAIREAGIFRMFTPKALGGLEASIPESLRVIEELSRYDGAVGWTAMIGSGGGAFLAYIDEPEARWLAGEGACNVGAGALAPKGVAKAVEGGYRLTGHWPFGSGCMHAAWHCGGAIVMDGAVVEDDVLLAAGSVVPPGKALRARSLYLGNPARRVRSLSAEEIADLAYSASHYVKLKESYR